MPLGHWLSLAWHRLGLAVNGYGLAIAAWLWLCLAPLGLGYGRLIWLLMAMGWCRLAMAALALCRLAWHRLGLAVNGYARLGAAWLWRLWLGAAWLGTAWAWLLMAMAWQSPLGYGRLQKILKENISLEREIK